MVGTPRKKREPIIVAMGMRAGTLAFFILLGGSSPGTGDSSDRECRGRGRARRRGVYGEIAFATPGAQLASDPQVIRSYPGP
jgi:hypothetical protein